MCVAGARRGCENSLFHRFLVGEGSSVEDGASRRAGTGRVSGTLEFSGDVEIAGLPPLEKGYVPFWKKIFLCGGEGRV